VTATVVAAPVRATVTVGADAISEAVAAQTERVEVELRGDGTARLTMPGRRDWGHADVVPRIEDRTLVLEPREVAVRGWTRLTSVAQRLPRVRVPLPRVADGAHVTGVDVEEGRLVVHGVYEEWREHLSPGQLDQLVRRIQRFEGGLLDLPRAGGGQ
jgi:hypothetical protein